MKYCFLGLMCFLCIALIILLFFVLKSKSEYSKKLSLILMMGIFVVFTYFLPYILKNPEIVESCFGVHYIFSEWLLLLIYYFYVSYSKLNQLNKRQIMILSSWAAINSALFLGNFFLTSFFETGYDEKMAVWYLNYKPMFGLHLFYSFFMLACILVRLLRKMHLSASIYKKMYLPVIVQLIGVFIMSVIRCFKVYNYDYVIFLYITTIFSICYYSLYATPFELVEDTIVKVAEDMKHGIFCFDLRGKCIYANKYSVTMFDGVSYEEIVEVAEQQFMRWKTKKNGVLPDYEKNVFPTSFHGIEKQMEFEFQQIKDKEHNITGYFVKLEDQTLELEKLKKERYQATHDHLTGLYRREYFYREVSKIMKNHPHRKWYIICSDISNFKLINDFLGEEMGDKLLRNQAAYIKTLCNDYCIAGRIISDRFAILMPEEQFDAQILEREVGQMQFIDESVNYQVRVVFGVYKVENIHENVRIMCDKAYMAFATIERDYQKHVVFYNHSMLDHMVYEKQILEDLNHSIEDNRFCVYFQPQADNTGKIVGAEALVRWNHPQLGLIYPDQFVKIYEKTGMIYKLDYYIWEEAAKKLSLWKKAGIDRMSISVNISAKDFYYADLANVFIGLAEKYDIAPQSLHLEITESISFMEHKIYFETLAKLQEYGFILEIDDFGSGYASLYRVQNLCADILKIDMMFLSKTTNAEKGEQILSSVIGMAKKLNMKVITEGVENQRQFEMLVKLGSDIFQGYYFSTPIPIEEFERKYLKIG